MVRINELNRCYRVLGLKPGASLDEINQAYKDLARIWHPDRMPQDDPDRQHEAHEKLKEINEARDLLRSCYAKQGAHRNQNTNKKRTTPPPPAPPPPPKPAPPKTTYQP